MVDRLLIVLLIVLLGFGSLVYYARTQETVGGERDEHGCLTPAGYAYDPVVDACIRSWELDASEREAAMMAVEDVGPTFGRTVIAVEPHGCESCYVVSFDTLGERMNVIVERKTV